MSRLKNLFKRNKSAPQPEQPAEAKQDARPTGTNADIANIPVTGMQRSNQGTYITSYSSMQPAPASSALSQQQTSSTISSSSSTVVDAAYTSKHGESQWKGKPNGQPYDKREELSEEDEDMWAKMAM